MGRSTRFDRPILAVVLATIMVLSVFAPIGVVGADTQTSDGMDGNSVEYTEGSIDAEPATIDEDLQSAEGTVEVVLRFEDADDVFLAESTDPVGTLQAQTDVAQQPFEEYAAETDGVDLERSFWLSNAALVTVDTERVPIEELARLEGVTNVHENFDVELPDRPESGEHSTDETDDRDDGSISSSSFDGLTTDGSDSDVATTYGLEQINAPDVWDAYDTKGEGTKVAVLDTGVDPDHPDIDIDEDNWGNFVDDEDGPHDVHGHGTHVSGTVVGGNESGTHIGVAPEATLYHGKVLGDEGAGSFESIVSGMEWAVEEDVDVLSMSLGGSDNHEYIEEIQNAEAAGTTVIAASGNQGEGTSGSPANIYDGLAIGATDSDEDVADFSSGQIIDTNETWGDDADEDWPDEYIIPDVVAPGDEVLSAMPDGEYEEMPGTSMATPHVAGAIALIQSAEGVESATATQSLVETAWQPDGSIEQDTRYGHGIIDVKTATDALAYESGIEGFVTNTDGEGIEEATTTVDNRDRLTLANGSYSFYTTPGEQTVVADAFGYESTEADVEVEEGKFTTADLELEETLDVSVVEDQPEVLESGETATIELQIASVETLTVDLEDGYDKSATELAVDGESEDLNDPINVGDRSEVTVELETDSEIEGELTATHTVTADGQEKQIETGPTAVYEDVTDVAVVDDTEMFGDEIVEALDEQAPPNTRFSVLTSNEAIEAVDSYEAFVVQHFGSENEAAIETFVSETESDETGVVYLDQIGFDANGISAYETASDEVALVDEDYNEAPPVHYNATEDHPVLDGVDAASSIPISDEMHGAHSWFVLEDETSFEHIADVGDDEGLAGSALAVDDETSTVLAASMGRTGGTPNDVYTDDADDILANAVAYAAGEMDSNVSFYGTADIEGDSVSEGDSVTAIAADGTEASAEIDDEGVYATEDNPLTLEGDAALEGETVTFEVDGLAATQTAMWPETDEPVEQDLTVDAGALEGTVTEETTGDPIDNATVKATNGDETVEERTDDDGTYAFENLEPDEYELEVDADGFVGDDLNDVSVSAGTTDAPVTQNVALVGDAVLEGTIDNGFDEPVADATVTVDGPYGPFEATTDNSGEYKIEDVPGTGGSYTVGAAAENHLSTTNTTTFGSGETETVDLSIEPTAVQIEIDETNSPIDAGEELVVDATVTNTADTQLNRTVEFELDGETVDSTELSLEGDESESIELTTETTGDDIGTHDAIVAIGENEVAEPVAIEEPDLPDVDIDHRSGSSTASNSIHGEYLSIASDGEYEFGADTGIDFVITSAETGESVTVSPNESMFVQDTDTVTLSLYDASGNIDDPEVRVRNVDGSNSTSVSLSGDTEMFASKTFSTYTVSLVDRDSELEIDSTGDRTIGIGYEAVLEQDGTEDEIDLTLPRDGDVDSDWHVGFELYELNDDGSPGETKVTKEIPNEAGDDAFEFGINVSELETGEYGWMIRIGESDRYQDQILTISHWGDKPMIVGDVEDDTVLEGTVTEEITDEPIWDASVLLIGDDNDVVAFDRTDLNGEYAIDDVESGEYDLRIEADGFDYDYEPGVSVDSDQNPETLNASLEGDAALNGTVTDAETDDPLSDVNVTADGPYGPFETTTDENGEYDLENIPGTAEEYTVDATAEDYEADQNTTILESGETDSVDLALEPDTDDPEPEPEADVTINETNSPVDAGQELHVNATVANTGEGTLEGTVDLDIDGETMGSIDVELAGDESDNLEFTYGTSDEDVGELNATVVIDGTEATESVDVIEAESPENGVLEGVVTEDDHGEAIEDATVELTDSDRVVADVLTDDDGTYEFTGLEAGEYDLEVDANGFENGTESDISVDEESTVSRNVSLVGDAAAEGTIIDTVTEDPLPDATVTVDGPYGPYETTTDENGEYEIEDIPGAGKEYTVEADADGYFPSDRTVEVSSVKTPTVNLALDPKDFEIQIEGAPGSVDAGETAAFEVGAWNYAPEPVTETVALEIDGDEVDDTEVDFDAGSYEELTLEWETDMDDVGYHDVGVTVHDAEDETTVEVAEAGVLDVEIGEMRNDGESLELEVDIDVENIGGATAEQTIWLDADGLGTDSVDVELDPDEQSTETLTVSIEDAEEGTYTVLVESDDDKDTEDIELEGDDDDGEDGIFLPPTGEPVFVLGSVDVPTDADVGDVAEFEVVVDNTGEEAGNGEIVFSLGDETVSETETIEAGDLATVTADVPVPDETGTYDLTIETDDDWYQTELTVSDSPEDDDSEADDESSDDGETETDDEAEADDDSDDDVAFEFSDGQPGFGVPAAVVALLIGLFVARVRS